MVQTDMLYLSISTQSSILVLMTISIARPQSFINIARDIDMTIPSVCPSVSDTPIVYQNG